MGVADGKRKIDAIDLTSDDDFATPQTPHPRKQVKTQPLTPKTSTPRSNPRYQSQTGGTSVYKTPQSHRDSYHNPLPTPPSSSQVPSLSQAYSSSFNDDEEVESDETNYEDLTRYGTIDGMFHNRQGSSVHHSDNSIGKVVG